MAAITEAELIEIEGRATKVTTYLELRITNIRSAAEDLESRAMMIRHDAEALGELMETAEKLACDVAALVALARKGGARPMGEPYNLRQDGVA